MSDNYYEKYVLRGDFKEWLGDTKNLKELSDEIGANWVLVQRFLTETLAENGFFVLSEQEIEKLKEVRE